MTDLTIRIGSHSVRVSLEPNQTYRVTSVAAGQEFTTTVTHVPAPVSLPTGTCATHREPLYDNGVMCLSCWGEYEAGLIADEG